MYQCLTKSLGWSDVVKGYTHGKKKKNAEIIVDTYLNNVSTCQYSKRETVKLTIKGVRQSKLFSLHQL